MDKGKMVQVIYKLEEVNRKGMQDLILFLVKSDYFTAPASSKYHLATQGGLLEHSINVYNIFWNKCKALGLKVNEESAIIAGLLHDICKVNLYIKTEDGYEYNEKFNGKGHSELTLKRLESFITLTPLEKAMIKFHMGTFGAFGKYAEYTPEELHEAIKQYPEVQIFASSDMEATQLEEQ